MHIKSSMWIGALAVLALAVAVAGYFDARHVAPVIAANGSANAATTTAPAPVPRVITIAPQTPIVVRLDETVSTRDEMGREFPATVIAPVKVNGEDVIPRGARATVHIVSEKRAGHLKGVAHLTLSLDSVERGGQSYAVETNSYSVRGGNHHKRNLISIGGGAGTGALIGGLAGGPVGLAIGLGAGAGAGTTVAAVTGHHNIAVPAETRITFALREPAEITVRN